MRILTQFLFPKPIGVNGSSIILLLFRLSFGGLIMTHGVSKCIHFDTLVTHFPNPIGISPVLSLLLVIFAELFCAFGFGIGLLYRLCLIPMIFSFSVIVFIVTNHAPFAEKELPLVYLCALVWLFFAGPGKFSFDYLIGEKLRKNRQQKLEAEKK